MSSAWGASWGLSWGNAWGLTESASVVQGDWIVNPSKKHHYIRRKGQILLFQSEQEVDAWLAAEQVAEEAVAQAKKTSRLARKRIRQRVYEAAPTPEIINTNALELLVERFALAFNIGALVAEVRIDQLLEAQALAWAMLEEEDLEMLLLM